MRAIRVGRAWRLRIDRLFLREEDTERALEDCLRDEPEWRGLLRVEEVEFSADKTSLN